MKDEALALAFQYDDPVRRLNVLREYVQSYVLRTLSEQEAFRGMAFVGGTALRFLENLPRFSEDLDFSVCAIDAYHPVNWMKKIKKELVLAGFDCALNWNDKKTVNVAWIRIAEVLKQAGLSHRADHKLAVKLEIDTRPPEGAQLVRTVVKRHMTFALCHYDRRSLMAGKVHALLTRPYPKGRDWFDLMWYRAHRPPTKPKLDLLQNALDQTQGKHRFEAKNWSSLLIDKLNDIEMAELIRDVSSFLERPADRAQFTLENLKASLRDAE